MTAKENIPVVILAGGMGTRIREQTEFVPKPMILVGNKPIIWHIMKIYAHYGYRRFIVCLGYKGDIIREYFLHYKFRNSDFTVHLNKHDNITVHTAHGEEDWQVTLAETGTNSMTGARIKRIEKYIDTDQFLLTYGDGLADIDIDRLVAYHDSHGKMATITGIRPPSRFGELIIKNDQVVEFGEKPQIGQGVINGGFFVMNRRVFQYLDDDDSCVLERRPLETLARDGQLMVYSHPAFWQCMDTMRDFDTLNDLWKTNKAAWKVWR